MSHAFNSHEKSVRKQWLILTIIALLAWPLLTLIFFTVLSKQEQVPGSVYWIFVSMALLTVLFVYILYRCAYVKPGIRFLTFLLIVGPLLKIKATMDALKTGHDAVTLIALAVNLGLYIWWYILSLQLRKMNKRIR